jgi:hypothetical protein
MFMQFKKSLSLVLCLTGFAIGARAQVFFADDFNGGASPSWGDNLGNWTASGGVYYTQNPQRVPLAFSILPFAFPDFAVDVDVQAIGEGGILLRGDATGHGVLLVMGGYGGSATSLYWHEMSDWLNYSPILNEAPGLWQMGDNIHLRVEVSGNTYSAYLNGAGTPATTLVSSHVAGGQVALIDTTFQTFDNFVIGVVPEPGVVSVLGLGLLGLLARRGK